MAATYTLFDQNLTDFQIIGIQSNHQEDYLFAYHLNQIFGLGFYRTQDLDLIVEGKKIWFSMFETKEFQENLQLISNVSNVYSHQADNLFELFNSQQLLLPKIGPYAFLMKISLDYLEEANQIFLNSIEQKEFQFKPLSISKKLKEKLIF
ncbi:MAG: IPExxxVDY family protein [Flavobacteriaceae bacterium]|nr:MAG: IPExxxVDY family protein [Flavobacteriaceae bacterium]